MNRIGLDFSNADAHILEQSLAHQSKAVQLLESLQKNGEPRSATGWFDYPKRAGFRELEHLDSLSRDIAPAYDLIVCIGIGGSYLGCQAVYHALSHSFSASLRYAKPELRQRIPIVFCGHNLSAAYHLDLIDLLDHHEPLIVVISKSGETLEPALAFRLLRAYMNGRYGVDELKHRIVAVTDKESGTLRAMANDQGWMSLAIPSDMGGRYSILSNAGIVPLVLAGLDCQELLEGADQFFESITTAEHMKDLVSNLAVRYASYRYAAHLSGKKIEVVSTFEPKLEFFLRWYQQLYGESLGKGGKGLFPAPLVYTTDLHSMGQTMQEGERNITQACFSVASQSHSNSSFREASLIVPAESGDGNDQLGYLAGRNVEELNQQASRATLLAHRDGGIGSLGIDLPKLSMRYLGHAFALFETACALEGMMMDLNPFDQPGVERYKKNMFALFGKPGTESLGAELRKSLKLR